MKFLIITATVLYLLFAVIVVRQVSLMDSTVKTSFAPQLKLLAYLHLLLTMVALFLFTVIL